MAAQLDADSFKCLEMRLKAAEARATSAEAQVKTVLASISGNHNIGSANVQSGSNQWQSSGDKMFVEELRLQRDAAQVSRAIHSRGYSAWPWGETCSYFFGHLRMMI